MNGSAGIGHPLTQVVLTGSYFRIKVDSVLIESVRSIQSPVS